MKLLIVESGEYSDFGYTPLVVSDDFDLGAAALAFKNEVCPPGKPPEPYAIGGDDLAGFLTRCYGARDLEPGEQVSYIGAVDDPIHYGSWRPYGLFAELVGESAT